MDPVTAVANAVAAMANMITEIVKGQTPEQKKVIWDHWIKVLEFWEKLLPHN